MHNELQYIGSQEHNIETATPIHSETDISRETIENTIVLPIKRSSCGIYIQLRFLVTATQTFYA